MSKMIYQWKEGQRRRADAQKVGERLEKLRTKLGGELRPDDVVEDARNPKSPLHREFEWDDTKAAEEHRKYQARKLIRAVVVIYDELPDAGPQCVFVNVQARGDQFYTTVPDAMSDEESRQYVLRKVLTRLTNIREEYDHLEEFAKVYGAIDELRMEIAA